MNRFEIMTDSAANLPEEIIREYKIHVLSLSYYIDGTEYKEYESGKERNYEKFYQMLRGRKNITTTEISKTDVVCMARGILDKGRDILYIGFSSALSSCVTQVEDVFKFLKEEYPERNMFIVDSLGASAGEGLLVFYAAKEREKRKTIIEVYRFLQENKLYICHEFMVEDLFYLRRGGRISSSTAILGTTLGVRPVMYVNEKGCLVQIGRTRGRKKAMDALVRYMEEYILKPELQPVFVSHADCEEDAVYLADRIRDKIGVNDLYIYPLNPVIAAHTGPGTLALFYYGEHRRKRMSNETLTHIFIVNPIAGGGTFADELREKLEKMEGLNYFIFTTRNAGYEAVIVKQVQELFQGEKIRFYCCGGSGTFRNMVDAIEKKEEVEVAFYPCGMSNDILKCFEEKAAWFKNLEALIHGKMIKIDYIQTDRGICLNSFSAGLDAEVLENYERFRGILALGNQIPYTLSVLLSGFSNNSRNIAVYIDGEERKMRTTEMIFGNGCAINGNIYYSEQPDLQDGKGNYFIAEAGSFSQLLSIFYRLRQRRTDKIREKTLLGTFCKIRIESLDGRPISGNLDGELMEGAMEWNLEIIPQGLHFIVPKGVDI